MSTQILIIRESNDTPIEWTSITTDGAAGRKAIGGFESTVNPSSRSYYMVNNTNQMVKFKFGDSSVDAAVNGIGMPAGSMTWRPLATDTHVSLATVSGTATGLFQVVLADGA